MFQPAVPVAKVLEGVHNSEYVPPAIQREFVWKTDQIRALFDSLMRGYPIGAFLFWKVGTERAAQLRRARGLGSPSAPAETLRPGATRRTLGVGRTTEAAWPTIRSSPARVSDGAGLRRDERGTSGH